MADLLRALATRKTEVRELKVDTLTPTQIADSYMLSKVNSVKVALLRGYEVPQEEIDLIDEIQSSTRSEAHKMFISYYSRGDYLPLNSLNSTYTYKGGGSVIGEQRENLMFLFYTSEGPDMNDVTVEDNTELIVIGLTPLTQGGTLAIMKILDECSNSKLTSRLTLDMALWTIDHPYTPKMVVHKKIDDVERFARQRGVDSVEKFSDILTKMPIALAFGMEEGDVLIETQLLIDPSSLTKRRVTLRVALEE